MLIEPFIIVKVFNKGVAPEGIRDANGHYIFSGEQYAEVGYLQRKYEKKRVVWYQRPKKQQSIYIHVA